MTTAAGPTLLRSDNSSTGYKYVFRLGPKHHHHGAQYQAKLKVAGGQKHLGYFATAEEAARVVALHLGPATVRNAQQAIDRLGPEFKKRHDYTFEDDIPGLAKAVLRGVARKPKPRSAPPPTKRIKRKNRGWSRRKAKPKHDREDLCGAAVLVNLALKE